MKRKKRFLLFIILSIYILPVYNQGWVVSNVIKGSTIEPQYSVIDNQNNLYVLASFNDTIYSPYSIIAYGAQKDVFLFKFNALGNILWYNRIGSTSLETAGGIGLDGSNNCYVTGSYYATCRFTASDSLLNTGNSDIYLAKYSSDGVFQWAKRVGAATTLQSSIDLKYDGNNHFLMAGFFKDSLIIGNNSSDKDTLIGNSVVSTFIAQFDLSGNHLWSKRLLSTSGSTRIRRIDISQNGYYFGGYFQGDLIFDIGTISSYQATTYDAFIYKTDFNGTGEWVRRIRGQNTENFKSLTTDEYDNVYVLGNYNSSTIYVDSTATITNTYTGNIGGYDTFIGKYNRSGILQWFIRKGSSSKDTYYDFVIRNNLIYATGYFANQIIFNVDTLKSSSTTNEDAFVAAFNEIGDPISGVSIVGTGNYDDAGTIVNMDTKSRAYVSGYYKSQQIKIGDSTYTSSNVNKSDLFFAIYKQKFKAVITDETEVSCYGLSDGMLQVTPYFGTPPYTYKWSHDANLHNSKATDLPVGSYTVTIYGSGGLDSASTVGTVTQPGPLNISSAISDASCFNYNDGSIDITVTGGTKKADYLYNWTSPIGSGLHPLEADQDSLSHGTYYLTVKDDNLCSLSDTILVLQPDPIRFDSTQVTDVINPPGGNGAINLEVTGGTLPYAYAWDGPSGYSSAAEDIDNLNGGLYTIVITDKNSCQNDSSFVVNDIDVLIAQVTAVTDLTCFGSNDGTATITVHNATLPLDYVWSDAVSFIDIYDTVHFRSNLTAGPYTVTITDAVAKSAVVNLQINDPATPLTVILDPTDLKCSGDSSGSVDLIVSGGTLPYTFLWNTGYTGEDLVNIAAGTYITTVTDAKGCIETGSTVVGEPTAISLSIDETHSIFCHGDQTGELTANASGGFGTLSYVWDDLGAQVTNVASQLFADTYHVTVTDENGCYQIREKVITEPDSITIVETIDSVKCFGGLDGSILVTVDGGTAPYFYEWSNGVFGIGIRGISDLPIGDYSLNLTDANNCTSGGSYVVSQPDSVYIVSVVPTDASCYGAGDGSILIDAAGGKGQFQYSVDNGLTFLDENPVTGLSSGVYQVVVRDENSCVSSSLSANISQPVEIIIDDVESTDISCNGSDDGSITIAASGGAGGFTYSIDGGLTYVDNNGSFTGLGPSTYEIGVMDATGCTADGGPVNIIEPGLIVINADVVNISCHGDNDGSISISASNGTGSFTYSIDGGLTYVDNGGSFTGLGPSTYEVSVMDSVECIANGTAVEITDPEILVIDTTGVVHISNENTSGTITLESTGGTPPVVFVIVPDSVASYTGQFTGLDTGTYRLFAVDTNNCRSNELNITILNVGTNGNMLILYDAFSPFTTPGQNDVWNIGNIRLYPNCTVKIFNTWGRMVFSSNGYAEPWDGRYNNKELPSGTYYYVIDPGDGSAEISGPVNIVY